MEFDADWIWFAIFAGIVFVRFIGSVLSRGRRRSGGKVPRDKVPGASRPVQRTRAERTDDPRRFTEGYSPPDTPKPIEPR